MARKPKAVESTHEDGAQQISSSVQQEEVISPKKSARSRKTTTTTEIIKVETKDTTSTAVQTNKKRKLKIEEDTGAAQLETPKKRTKTGEGKVEENNAVKGKGTPKKRSKTVKDTAEEDIKVENEDTPKKRSTTTKKKLEIEEKVKREDQPEETKVKRKRKTKEEKEAEAMPLAARTVGHKLFIGAHVSASGGVHKAVLNSVHIGANAFALFLKSQRKWANPALADDVATMFHANCKTHVYDAASHIVPHGSYLVNLAHTDPDRTKQAYDSFLDDLQRCERLGIKLYNFHPGNTTGGDRASAIKHLASNINRAHKETSSVVTLLENMAAGGNIIGTTFEDLRDTISHVEDKERVGVCLDTCHAFAAGYDLRSPEAFKATLQQFDDIVGMKYLRALHINDSKAPFQSRRDLHANIGTGYLGLRAFHNIVNEARFVGLPLVLETPTTTTDDNGDPIKDEKGKEKEDANTWAREIKLLESMVDMDVESEEFLTLEKTLAGKGEKERKRVGDQADRRKEKDAKNAAKAKKKQAKDDASDTSELSELEEG